MIFNIFSLQNIRTWNRTGAGSHFFFAFGPGWKKGSSSFRLHITAILYLAAYAFVNLWQYLVFSLINILRYPLYCIARLIWVIISLRKMSHLSTKDVIGNLNCVKYHLNHSDYFCFTWCCCFKLSLKLHIKQSVEFLLSLVFTVSFICILLFLFTSAALK